MFSAMGRFHDSDMTIGPFDDISFRALFDAAADAMLVVDGAGRIVLANASAHRLLGYAPNELAGLSVEMLIPEPLREAHLRPREGFQAHPSKRPMGLGLELYAVNRAGEEIPVDISLSPLTAGNGEPLTLATLYGTVERNQAKHELQISEERLRLAAEAANFGTFDIDLAAGTLYWSPELRNIVGLPPGADSPKLGEEFSFLPPDEVARVRGVLCAAYDPRGNGEIEDEQRIVRPDGGTRWVLVKGKAHFSGQGGKRRAVRVTGVVLDITERKKMEREILEKRKEMDALQKLQVAAQTASAFAHELNQPLLAIASYSEAVLMLLESGNPNFDKIRKAVEASERQAHRAGQSIRELLDFLSMNEFPTEALDLNQEIFNVLAAARLEQDTEFNTVLQLESGLAPVRANRTHVQKVLLNLLHNGIEAMHEARVPLPSITVTVRMAEDARAAQVTICDNGPGFKPEDIKRLFEPFYTTKARGIGMGLTVSRSLIEANGGELWVEPQEGPGATFHLTLPLAA